MNKSHFQFAPGESRIAVVVCALALLAWEAAGAELLYNPGFESPIGVDAYGNFKGGANFPLGMTTGGEAFDPSWRSVGHWMIAYPWGGPDDFECKDRCTNVKSSQSNGQPNYWSAHLRPDHDKWAHAYYTQTVTNLTQGHTYLVKGYMMEDRWKSVGDAKRDELKVYIEAIGGTGSPTADGRYSLLATNNFTDYQGNPDSNIDVDPATGLATYPTTIWRPFFTPQTPDSHGEIEVRLHVNKPSWVLSDKLELENAYFDDMSLTP